MVASRWLWRLMTLLEGALGAEESEALLGPECVDHASQNVDT